MPHTWDPERYLTYADERSHLEEEWLEAAALLE